MSAPTTSQPAAIAAELCAAGCVFAEDEAALLLAEAGSAEQLRELVARRVSGIPLEQVLGWAEFCGLRIAVEPGVFVPRRRTGLVVSEALAGAPPRPVILDLCCGSGAVGVAVAAGCEGAELYGADLDPAAVACARGNVARAGGGAVFEGDLFDPLPAGLRGRIDILLVNAPYVPSGAISSMPPEARLHEPRLSLDGGADGLDVQRRVARQARPWLAPGGRLLVETSRQQASGTLALLTEAGLDAEVVRSEELDATVVTGTRPPVQGGGR